MPGEPTDALVLRAVDYRDADRIVTLLTAAHGKVAVLARSARRSRKRFGGSLEPYAIIEAEVRLGRGEVGGIGQARVTRSFPAILSSLPRMTVMGAALELVREALPQRQPEPEVFAMVTTLLESMAASQANEEELFLAFAARLLSHMGFAPNLESCARCGRTAPATKSALFDAGLGSIVCRACGGAPIKLGGEARAFLSAAAAASGSSAWAEPARSPLGVRTRDEARRAIMNLADHSLGKKLKASMALAQLRELG